MMIVFGYIMFIVVLYRMRVDILNDILKEIIKGWCDNYIMV